MKLLVIGATGQLGADLVRLVADSDVDEAVAVPRAELDLERPEGCEAVLDGHGADWVVNCAAYNDTAGAETDAVTAFQVNAYGPERLAAAARSVGAGYVQVSTDYVFDGTAGRAYREDDAPAPLGVYGASKLAGEALTRRAHPDGTVVVRTAALFGRAGVRTGNFVETIVRAAAEAGPLRVVRDIVVSPTGTAELAEGLVRLLRSGPSPGTYHRVCAGATSWSDFAAAIVDAAGLDAAVEAVPAAEHPSAVRRPAFSVLADVRAADRVGPMPHWRDALERYLEERDAPPAPRGESTR